MGYRLSAGAFSNYRGLRWVGGLQAERCASSKRMRLGRCMQAKLQG